MPKAAKPIPPLTESDKERFWAKVDRSGGSDACWLWMATKQAFGYGRFGLGGRAGSMDGAHRVSYTLAHGPIPDGLLVCHNCPGGDNPGCVNPAHLFLGTHDDNMSDMASKGRHFSKTQPQKLARGDRHGSRSRPESRPRGAQHPKAKLNRLSVLAIRFLYASGEKNQPELARFFGLSQASVSQVILRKSWQHIP